MGNTRELHAHGFLNGCHLWDCEETRFPHNPL
jgi:hypothetical protein